MLLINRLCVNYYFILPGVETANSVSKRLGIKLTNLEKAHKTALVLTGEAIAKLTKEKLDKLITEYSEIVCARLSPNQKVYIVESCQRAGAVVTMIGDGINDVYALRTADISNF